MELVGLWRYPVKSMQGERLDSVEMEPVGVAGDRRYGVRADASGWILSAKREGRLLAAHSSSGDPVRILLPTGVSLHGQGPATDAALSAWLQRPVRLVRASHEEVPTFESQADDTDDDSASTTWPGHRGVFVDSSAVHLLTTASLRAVSAQRPDLDWRVERFRPNLLVDAAGDERIEDDWVGRRCSVGDVELEIVKPCQRCVMITRRQPGGFDRQLGVLTHLARTAHTTLGVLARVTRPGPLAVGAPVSVD